MIPIQASYSFEFETRHPTTLLLTDADSTPTVTLYANGAASGISVTVASTGRTGIYSATCNTSTLTAGDRLSFEGTATVAAQTDSAVLLNDVADVLVSSRSTLTAAGVWDLSDGIETGFTPRGTMRIIAAAVAGKMTGGGTTTEVFRNLADGTNRITATVDASGNRSDITYNAS